MSDSISRQAVIELWEKYHPTIAIDAMGYDKALRSIPAAEPERMKGKWIRITQGAIPEQYICPFCHRTVETYGVEELLKIQYPYCHCGADMRGEEKARYAEDGEF